MTRPLALAFLAAFTLPLFTLSACAGAPPPMPEPSCEVKRLSELPVTMSGRLPTVTAKIDGVNAQMVFDTGADRLLLTEAALPRFNIQADARRSGVSSGVNGSSVSHPVTIEKLVLGTVDLGRRDADVVPFVWPSHTVPLDGFLAGSILFIFDIDIDMPHRRVTLYYPRKCPDGTPPWTGPFTTLVAEPVMAGHAHLAVHALLEGKDVLATIDTGAETSLVSRRAARLADVSDEALERDRSVATYGFGPSARSARLHRFNELRVGGELLIGRIMAVADLPDGAGDMLLGEDWLQTHRVWLSYSSSRIYVARSSPP